MFLPRHCYQKATLLLAVLVLVCPPVWAETARVAAVPTAKTLQLEDGRIVRLAAVQAPNRARNARERDDALAQQAHATMQQLAKDKTVRIEPVADAPDRHGRIVARVYGVQGQLLQEKFLRAGMGWAYTFPDTRDMAAALLAAEQEAEQEKRGVWAEPAYAVLSPEQAEKHRGEFRLVEGVVQHVAEVRGRYYLNFGEDWKTDFTLLIERGDAKRFDAAWLQGLEGRRVRARGWLFRMNGPAMELTHPEQLQLR